jgi:SAM-dependent methyltransferase
MESTAYGGSARYYDLIYGSKDYRAEVEKLLDLLRARGCPCTGSLLDVGCGTGRHLEFLGQWFIVEGLDISSEMLAAARQRHPAVELHRADMTHFNLERTYDVVTCLFSAIGYARDLDGLWGAVTSMVRHLAPGGWLAIEPWFTPGTWVPGSVHATMVADNPNLKLARVSTSLAEGRLSYFELHHLVGTPEGTEHFVERHEMGLFEEAEMQAALELAGLDVCLDPEGLTGRGLWMGRAAS